MIPDDAAYRYINDKLQKGRKHMDTGYNDNERDAFRRPAPHDPARDAFWGREQQESETYYVNPLAPHMGPGTAFASQAERDAFHADIAAWLEGQGQV